MLTHSYFFGAERRINMEKNFYTPEDVRQEVFSNQISTGTLLTMLHNKEIPSIRMRRRFYIPGYWVRQQLDIAQGKGEMEREG